MTFKAKEIHRAMAILETVHPALTTARASIAELAMIINYTQINAAWDIIGQDDLIFLRDFYRRWKTEQEFSK